MADNLPIFINSKDRREGSGGNLMVDDQQPSRSHMLHEASMRPEPLWENSYRNVASASAHQQQHQQAQQQARAPPLWDTDKNLSGAVLHRGLDPIDMTMLSGRPQLYAGLAGSGPESIAGGMIPSSVHQLHRGSPSVPTNQAMGAGVAAGSAGKQKLHAYKDSVSDSQGFVEALRKNNSNEIKRLLDKGVDVNYLTESGSTPLHNAAKSGDYKLLEMLILYGADTSKRDKLGKLADDYLKSKNMSVEQIKQNLLFRSKNKQSMNYLGWLPNHAEGLLPGPPATPIVPDMLLYQHSPYLAEFQKYTHLLGPPPISHLGHPSTFAAPLSRLQPDLLGNYEQTHTAAASMVPPPAYDRFPSPFDHIAHPSNSAPTLYNPPKPKYASLGRDEKSPLTNSVSQYTERQTANYQHPLKGKSVPASDSLSSRYYKRDIYENYSSSKMPKSRDYRSENEAKHRVVDKSLFHIDHLVKTNSSSSTVKPPRNTSEFSGKSSYSPSISSCYQENSVLSRPIDVTRIKPPLSTSFYGLDEQPRKALNKLSASTVSSSTTSSVTYYPYQNGESSFSPYRQNSRHAAVQKDILLKRPHEPLSSLQNMSAKNPTPPHSTVQSSSYYSMATCTARSVVTTAAPLNGLSLKSQEKYLQRSGGLPKPNYFHEHRPNAFGDQPSHGIDVTTTSKHEPVSISMADHLSSTKSTPLKVQNVDCGIKQHINGATGDMTNYAEVPGDAPDCRSLVIKSPSPEKPHVKHVPEDQANIEAPKNVEQKDLECAMAKDLSESRSTCTNADGEPKVKKGRKRKATADSNESAEKKKRSKSTDVDSTSTDTLNKLSSDELPAGKRAKKSETDDDYLWATYDDFSSSDPENDDSSDEDFCCPIVKPVKGRSAGLAKRRPKRRLSRQKGQNFAGSSDHSMDVLSDFEQPINKKRNQHHRGKAFKGKQKHTRKTKGKKLRTISSESGSSFKEHLSQSDEDVGVGRVSKTRSTKRRKPLDRSRLKRKVGSSNARLKDRLLKSRVSEKLGRKAKQHKLKRKHKNAANSQNKGTHHKDMDQAKAKCQTSPDKKQQESKCNKLEPVTTSTSSPAGISATLMELYTGTAPSLQPSEQRNHSTNLFGDELTEKEAQVLSKALNTEKQRESIPTPANSLPEKNNLKTQQIDGKEVDVFPTKHKKRRGRKPKGVTETDVGVEKKLKKQKLASQLKDKFNKHKLLKMQHPEKLSSRNSKMKQPSGKVDNATTHGTEFQEKERSERSILLPPVSTPSVNETSSFLTPVKIKEERDTDLPLDHVEDTPTTSKLSCSFNDFRSFQPCRRSRSSTPLSFLKDHKLTPHPSPIPPNMKKLTCNSAIGETVLHKAARFGYVENVQHYLERGTDVNTKDNAGYSALHEACVHNQLETARLLLGYGADVNLNSTDGTRPIHDAIEYDHLEMTRLLLSCGADPLLSKFSGRSIKNMIRSSSMEKFFTGYLKELKPLTSSLVEDPNLEWKVAPSAVLDKKVPHGYEMTDYPPSSDEDDDYMDFKVFDQPPLQTYFVQPSENSKRTNYYLLEDLLEQTKCSRGEFLLQFPVDIKTMTTETFLTEISTNWVPDKCSHVPSNVSDCPLVELVVADHYFGDSTTCRVFDDGKVEVLSQECKSKSTKVNPSEKTEPGKINDEPCCSYTPHKANSPHFTTEMQSPLQLNNFDSVHDVPVKKHLDFGKRLLDPSSDHHNNVDENSSIIVPLTATPSHHQVPFRNSVEHHINAEYMDGCIYTNNVECSPKPMELMVHKKSPFQKYDERKLENGFCGLGAANVHLNANTL